MTDTQNPQFEYPAYPDYGVWTRAVERVVDALDLDFYPTEALVAQCVEELFLNDADDNDQMQALEDELIALLDD